MKRKPSKILMASLAVTIAFVGYLLGNAIPLNTLTLLREASAKENVNIAAQILTATATLLAVITALFQHEIRKIWHSPRLEIRAADVDYVREVMRDTNSSSIGGSNLQTSPISAQRYETILEVSNHGTATAQKCALRLESLEQDITGGNFETIDIAIESISWRKTAATEIPIGIGAKTTATIITLIEPKEGSNPAEKGPATLQIGNHQVLPSGIPGITSKWRAKFALHAEGIPPETLLLEILWTGRWESRLVDIKRTNFKIKEITQ